MKESYFSRFFGMSFLAAAFALTSCGKSSTEDKPTPKPKTPVVVGPSESQTALQNTTDQKTFEFNQQFNEQYTKHGIAVDLPSFATHGFELKRRTDEVLARANQLLELFVEMPTHELSFDNAIKFIDVTIYRISEVYGQAYLLRSVSNCLLYTSPSPRDNR